MQGLREPRSDCRYFYFVFKSMLVKIPHWLVILVSFFQGSLSAKDVESACRFKNFRVAVYRSQEKNAKACTDYLDPRYELLEEDVKIWLPVKCPYTKDLTEDEHPTIILTYASDTFCRIVREEHEVLDSFLAMPEHGSVVFKRLVGDGRETCDVCETTIFNYH